jgi:hypothetical protein
MITNFNSYRGNIKMKVKEMFYIETTNFTYLNDTIAEMLRQGWEPYGHIVVNGPFYLQGMVKHQRREV